MSNKDQNITIKQLSFITKSRPVLLKCNELKEDTNQLAEEIHPKIRGVQGEVAYLADKFLI